MPFLRSRTRTLTLVAGIATLARPATALDAPWSDAGLLPGGARFGADRYGLTLRAEYRVAAVAIDDLDLADRDVSWFEQRLRIGVELDHADRVRLVTSADALDGIFGAAGGVPDSGARLLEAPPGTRRLVVGYTGPGDPSARGAYGLVLVPADAITFRRVYLEVVSGLGVLRVGRMPPLRGASILWSDGESGQNRFGVSGRGDTVDRAEITVKPFAAFEPESQADPRGLRISAHYDRLAASSGVGRGAASRAGVIVSSLDARPAENRMMQARAHGSLAWATPDESSIGLLGASVVTFVSQLGFGAEGLFVTGSTRAVSESLAVLTPAPATRQRVEQWGSRVVARWDERRWTAYLELDYASGDARAEPSSTLTRFDFARDANVGLLMFEHVLAYESARSAAAGAARLVELGGRDTLAADRGATGGAFTSAVALFPQFDLRPIDSLLVRGGVLFAWAPDGLVDPVLSLDERADAGPLKLVEPVGFRGGPAEGYVGTELDARVTWRYAEGFRVEAEGALLFPGSALHDADGRARTSSLLSLRAEAAF